MTSASRASERPKVSPRPRMPRRRDPARPSDSSILSSLLVGNEREHARGRSIRRAHLQRRNHNLGARRQKVEIAEVLEDHSTSPEPDLVQVEGLRIDWIRGGAVEADTDDATLDERACCVGVGVRPAGPVPVAPPVPAVVGADEEPVALAEIADERLELVPPNDPRIAAREVEG